MHAPGSIKLYCYPLRASIFYACTGQACIRMHGFMLAVQRLTLPRAESVARCLKKVVLKMVAFYLPPSININLTPSFVSITLVPASPLNINQSSHLPRRPIYTNLDKQYTNSPTWSESEMSLISQIPHQSSRQRPTTLTTRLYLGMSFCQIL